MEDEIINNSYFYKFSENGIKKRNYKLWETIASYDIEGCTFKEKFYLFENSISVRPKCYCGNYLKFIDMNTGYRSFCSKACMYNSEGVKEKRKVTSILNWGVDNPSKSPDVKEKVKKTNNELFGVDYPLQSAEILNKSKNVFINKFGVDNPSKVKEVREKAQNTMLGKWGVKHAMQSHEIKNELKEYFVEKFGVDNPSKVKEVREKAQNTMLEKWGVRHALQKEEFLEKLQNTNFQKWGEKSFTSTQEFKNILIRQGLQRNSNIVNNERYTLLETTTSEYSINCNVCNSEFTIQRQLWRNRHKNGIEICLNCNPICNGVSKQEKKILNYIQTIYQGEIIENFKLGKREIDIYLPDLRIGFEYNGLFWHSELNKTKTYHYNKMAFFREADISLMQIWEDDWEYRREIVESMIRNKLGLSSRIFARKCQIREITDNKIIKNFLESNHIQGFVGSKIKLGLFFNNELVSLMTFGGLRKSLGHSSSEDCYELLRFCNKINISVIGGASKLFNYFLKKFQVREVISYSLNSYSTGNLYEQLNFKLAGETGANYFWCKNGIKYHRFNFRKDKLVNQGFDKTKTEIEIMYDRGYFRVFDCGSKKFVFHKTAKS